MLTKFESKSPRVKGLAFHPVRPWICASLHSGAIQLWDYRVGTVIDRFEEHEGPVRGVDFHPRDSLIVSGGDDYKVKVWDYKLHRCLFTLLNHLDYIRTVVFHPNSPPMSSIVEGDMNQTPWILSASDDQTIRIWNYYTRNCISVLTGHNHYVMCAQFHHSDNLIVSASLDQTVRVWDTSGLKRESRPPIEQNNPAAAMQNEFFGQAAVVVKYVLEGHDRGVNWASFHPTLPLIASAADDRSVKLWRMSESKAWEVDTLRGHNNNVSSVLFHPKYDLMVSNSEDKSIRVWDVSKRVNVQTFRRDLDRFWIIAACKKRNLLAAGHDSGMLVFKLERERPPNYTFGNKTYFIRSREVLLIDGSSGRERSIYSIRRSSSSTDGIGTSPRYLHQNCYEPQDKQLLITSDTEGGSYELVTISNNNVTDGKKGNCVGPAFFLARNRFCILDRSKQLVIKNLNNETTKRVNIPLTDCTGLLDGGVSGRILVKSEDRVLSFDTGARRVIGEVQVSKVKFAIWSADRSHCALVGKYSIAVVTKNMESVTTINDTVRIKSGQWSSSNNGNDLFVFATSNHIKYLLKTGDVGIIRALDDPVYLTQVVGNSLYSLDREGRQKVLQLDLTEAEFKLALEAKNYPRVMELIAHSNLCGKSLVNYLQDRGYPEVALHFVREPKTRFELALACGNLEAAMASAFELEGTEKSDAIWRELGAEALRQGNHNVVEMSYQRTKDFDRLSFLYLISGDTEKLRKMLKIASMRKDVMGCYYNALLLGDASERVSVLEESGNLNMAYICAQVHGLEEDAARIKQTVEAANESVEGLVEKVTSGGPKKGCLLLPPTPILRSSNWPTLPLQKTTLEDLHAALQSSESKPAQPRVESWGGDGDAVIDEEKGYDDIDEANDFGDDDFDLDDGDGGWDDDLDLGGFDDESPKAKKKSMADFSDQDDFILPKAGKSAQESWISNSSHIADHAAAGSISTACQLLHRQISASNFSILEANLMGSFFAASATIPGIPGCMNLNVPLMRNDINGHPSGDSLPIQTTTLKTIMGYTKLGYRAFQTGKFSDSKAAFEQVLLNIPFCVTSSKGEANEVKELLEIAREYITAIRIKNAIAETKDPARGTELSAYFTHCNIQPPHLLLALRSAMGTAFKSKNFITAASFARRLLELPDMKNERNSDLRVKASKVLQKSEAMARNEHKLNYNDSSVFRIDCKDFVPMYNNQGIKCAYCGSVYGDEMKGKKCLTCNLSVVGVETLGLVTG